MPRFGSQITAGSQERICNPAGAQLGQLQSDRGHNRLWTHDSSQQMLILDQLTSHSAATRAHEAGARHGGSRGKGRTSYLAHGVQTVQRPSQRTDASSLRCPEGTMTCSAMTLLTQSSTSATNAALSTEMLILICLDAWMCDISLQTFLSRERA